MMLPLNDVYFCIGTVRRARIDRRKKKKKKKQHSKATYIRSRRHT